jgi:hypothetical protein
LQQNLSSSLSSKSRHRSGKPCPPLVFLSGLQQQGLIKSKPVPVYSVQAKQAIHNPDQAENARLIMATLSNAEKGHGSLPRRLTSMQVAGAVDNPDQYTYRKFPWRLRTTPFSHILRQVRLFLPAGMTLDSLRSFACHSRNKLTQQTCLRFYRNIEAMAARSTLSL